MRHVLFVSLLAFAATAACSGSPAPVPQPTPPVAPTPTPPVAPTPAPTAPTATAAPAVPASKPVAAELLAQSLRFTQSLPAMQLKGTATLVMPELPEEIAAQLEGIELPSFEVELAVAMPNRFALNAGEEGMSRVVCDGAQLLQANDRFQLHSLAPAPKDLLTFFDAPRDALGTPGQGNLRALLAPAGAKKALIDAKQVELVGDGKVGGKDAWQLAIKDEGLACELWVMKGDEPWVLRHKPARQKLDMEALMGGGGEEDEGGSAMSIQPGVEIEFSSCSKGIAKDTFTIEEPKGSTKVDDLQEALMERMQAEMGEMEEGDGEDAEGAEGGGDGHGAHASVGKPAPDVELAMMDGSKQKLADLKGKVVVLDFWATWCGPCVQGLPKVTEVTKKLADQGVVFVACNLGEDKATIEKFLQKKQLSIAVALCDQAMGGKFGVSGIPHTVVIGADGVVKKVHVGFAPGGEKQLEKDLLEVLGKPATEGQPAEGHKDDKKADAGGK